MTNGRATFNVKVKGNFVISGKLVKDTELNLTFLAEPNIIEKQRIKNETSQLLGGRKEVVALDIAVQEAYKKHLDYCNGKYGADYQKMRERIETLEDEEKVETEEYQELFDKLYTNQFYTEYCYLINSRMDVGEYAFLNVMCINKPDGFNFYDQQDEAELGKIVKEVKAQRKFFREPVKKNKKISKPSTDKTDS